MDWYLYPIHWHLLATEYIAANPAKALYIGLAAVVVAIVVF
jgi:hypothetical protein